MNEIDDQIIALENQYNDLKEISEEESSTNENKELVEDSIKEEIEDNHSENNSDLSNESEENNIPGYIDNIEDWIAAGKDPDLFKGKKAYKQEYERIQEIKKINQENKEMSNTLKSTLQTIEVYKQQMEEKHQEELKIALKKAREEQDIDKALEVQERLNNIKNANQNTPPLHPIIQNIIQKNPIIDRNSNKFNPEFFDDMKKIQQRNIDKMSVKGGSDLTDSQIERLTRLAFLETEEIHKKLNGENNPLHKAQVPPTIRRPLVVNNKQNDEEDMQNITLNTPRISNANKNAANDIYQLLKKMDPDSAKTFAKKVREIT